MKTVQNIPASVVATLWSYDITSLNLERDKALIIYNVLNYGTSDATSWLNNTYDEKDIRAIIKDIPRSAWDKKSIALWSLIYDVTPSTETRVVT